jgi:threonine/homoserine/homoserine lactone efflux protein
MNTQLLIGLVSFVFVTSVTPGPNNLMLMASGANFGFRRTVPHMLGISLGFGVMVVLTGLGLNGLFQAYPSARTALKVLSVLYMMWLAWNVAHAAAPGQGGAGSRPMTLLQAAAFQWVNPKAWAMAIGALSAYVPGPGLGPILLVAALCTAINLPSVSVWAKAGERVRLVLTNPNRRQMFNWTMAVLLVLSLWPVLQL